MILQKARAAAFLSHEPLERSPRRSEQSRRVMTNTGDNRRKKNPFSEQRTATVSTRVTDDEYKELEALAQARKQTMSEWVREVLPDQRGEPAGHAVVLAEMMALRAIVLNLAMAHAQGETMSEERIRGTDPVCRCAAVPARE